MKKQKVLKRWVDYPLQATIFICLFAMVTNAEQDMLKLIIGECILGTIVIICGCIVGKYSRDFINED